MSERNARLYDDGGGSGGTIGGGGSDPMPAPTPTPTPSPVTPVAPPIAPPTSAIVAAIIGSAERTGTSVTLDQIPLLAVAAQKVVVQLGAQSCIIQVYQKATGLYFDLLVGTKPIVLGALCRDRVWIIRDGYLGFDGDVAFIDTQGVDDPFYTGLADRYQLVWGH